MQFNQFEGFLPQSDQQKLMQVVQMLQSQQERAPIDYTPFSMQNLATPQPQAQLAGVTTDGETQPGFDGASLGSGQAGDRALDALGGRVGSTAAKAGLTGLAATVAGVPGGLMKNIGSAINPMSLASSIPSAMTSAMGVSPNPGMAGGLMSYAPAAIASLFGLSNPVTAIAGLLGNPFADAVGDYTGMRDLDAMRDDVEDTLGEIGGRTSYSDAMQGTKELSPEVYGAMIEANPATTREAIDHSISRLGSSAQLTPANLNRNVELQRAIQALSGLQSELDSRRSIQGIGNTGNTSLGDYGGYSGIDGIGNSGMGGLSGNLGGDTSGSGLSGSLGNNAGTGGFDYGSAAGDWGGNDSGGFGGNDDGGFGDRDSDTGTGGV